ncbi:RTA-like protein [Fusarium austroafricanum]|uniref:RTA-like protein n=1 Tax=Fusarium austroafricanum TaxID=2364996 RepID=A0A8H4P6A5_9HYPO|nr:RTA-like protein [Fusarium austroafricanum]
MAFDRNLCTMATCSVEKFGWYHYVPNLGANAFYLAVFAVFAIVQLYLAIRYRVWGTFAGGLVLGCVTEAIGYAGRVMQARGDGIFKKKCVTIRYFVIQLVCLTIAPALISAPIYLSLGRVVKAYGRQFSLMSPRTYAVIFICSDAVSLILQAMGGGLAATGKKPKKVDMGVHILVAGLAYQVLSLGVFIGLAMHLWSRVRSKGTEGANPRFRELRASRQLKSFIWALSIATITITIRCIYRVVELAGGFKSEPANDEPSLMVLDGPMIMAALLALTICHPGPLFFGDWKRLGEDSGYPEIGEQIEQVKQDIERK